VNSAWLYTAGFEKHEVIESLTDAGLHISPYYLEEIAHGFIRYFNSSDEYISLTVKVDNQTFELFNREEVLHFKDVKTLFRLDYAVLLGTFLYILAYTLALIIWGRGEQRRRLARGAVIGSGVTLGILLLLGIGVMLDFNALWLRFHFLSFSNEFWSAEGNMLQLFPGGFWYDMVVYCALFAAGVAVVLGGMAGIYIFRSRKKEGTTHGKDTQSHFE
jgi:integral membrane protein (TIGR01906 family)